MLFLHPLTLEEGLSMNLELLAPYFDLANR